MYIVKYKLKLHAVLKKHMNGENKMKKTIIILITMVLGFINSSPIIAYATTSEDIKENQLVTEKVRVVEDTQDRRVAVYTENEIETVAIYDKENNIITIESPNTETITIDLAEKTENLLEQQSETPNISPMARTVKENTFINYEYTITFGSKEVWQLRRPKNDSLINYYYKNVTRNSSNKSNLDNFKRKVDEINDLEFKIIGQSLTTLGASWLSFILSVPTAGGATLTAGLTALGAYGAALNNLVKLHGAARDAEIYYHRAK